jgi:ATP-dependent protease ClpP protease subunit
MTIRELPELHRPNAPQASFVLNEKAVQAWSPGLMPTAAADDNAVISILDVIGVDFWTGEGITAKRIAGALRAIGDKPVIVQINSPGGDFFEGVAIYNLLRQHPAEVTVQIIGIAASAASMIAMAGDRIEIGKTAFVMTHNTQWVAVGDRHMMRETGDIMETFDATLNQMYADRTGQPVETIAAWNDVEHWIAGQKAIEEGFADALLAADVKQGSAGAKNHAPTLYRVEAALTRQGMPRAERRRIMKEITEGTPGAASDVTPRADDDDDADDGIASLRLAAARMSLLRA